MGVNPETAVSPVKYSTNRNQRGPLVFSCLLDFGKAFDKVNFRKLFEKLIEKISKSDKIAIFA